MKKTILFAVLNLMLFSAIGQNIPHCGTDEYTETLINNNPEIAQQYAQTDQYMQSKMQTEIPKKSTQATVYTIPVVFHIIYNSPADNISKSQILDGLRVLNEDWSRQNADTTNTRAIFKPVAANMQVHFELAKKDPQGNCTDGINRIQSSLSVNADDAVKDLIHWDNTKYLNIWVVNSINSSNTSGTILGYAYRPYFGQDYKHDGILVVNDHVGTIGTSSSEGRTLSHEVGHFLGLKHTFDGGCTGGDDIADTPPVASASFGSCDFTKNSCHNDSPDQPDMIENFMDYADDVCQNMFTEGQKTYTRSYLETANLRKELHESSNLLATGITNPPACQPTANFALANKVICAGEMVQFYDETEDGNPTSYSWSFPGGTPSTSSAVDPIITYPVAGQYDVTLTVTNAAGTSTKTMQKMVNVKSQWSGNNAQWIEDFEQQPTLSAPEVTAITTYDTIKFHQTTAAASSGIQSVMLDNFNADQEGEIDALVSPEIYTIFGKNLVLSFDYAFACRATTNSDILRVYASADCGATWSLRKVFAGTILRSTTNPVSIPFVPSGAQDWKTGFVGFDVYKDSGPILIKFEFTHEGGNNLYIDNINFTADNVGLDENLISNLQVYPNPASDHINIDFGQYVNEPLKITISDITGKTVYTKETSIGGENALLNDLNLTTGVYILNIQGEKISHSEKLMIE